jgi:hypothetical protein
VKLEIDLQLPAAARTSGLLISPAVDTGEAAVISRFVILDNKGKSTEDNRIYKGGCSDR